MTDFLTISKPLIERGATASLYMKKGATDVWLTPRSITERLGLFDLDPCAAVGQPWQHAVSNFTEEDDGTALPWSGRVWMNPPYSSGKIQPFIERFVTHRNGIALVFPRTDTKWFQQLLRDASAALFYAGRISFVRFDGANTTQRGGFLGSVFVAYGDQNVQMLKAANFPGVLMRPERG